MILENRSVLEALNSLALNESVWDRMRDNQKRFHRAVPSTKSTTIGDAKRFLYDLAKRAKSFIPLDYEEVHNTYDNVRSPLFTIDAKVEKTIDDLRKQSNFRELTLGNYAASFGHYTENGKDHWHLIRIRKIDNRDEYNKFAILLKVE